MYTFLHGKLIEVSKTHHSSLQPELSLYFSTVCTHNWLNVRALCPRKSMIISYIMNVTATGDVKRGSVQ